eukprot:gene3857-4457_t
MIIHAYSSVKIALPALAQLVYNHDEKVLSNSCQAVSDLTDGPKENIKAVVDAAHQTVANLASGDESLKQIVINLGALSLLRATLTSGSKMTITREACSAISNITDGNMNQIQSVIDHHMIPILISTANYHHGQVKKQAILAITNAIKGGTPQQISFIVHQGCIPPLCSFLTCPEPVTLYYVLEGIENILAAGKVDLPDVNPYLDFVQESGGVEMIIELQNHKIKDIFERAFKICTDYFYQF